MLNDGIRNVSNEKILLQEKKKKVKSFLYIIIIFIFIYNIVSSGPVYMTKYTYIGTNLHVLRVEFNYIGNNII